MTAPGTVNPVPVEMRRQAHAELDAAMERFCRDLARALGVLQ